MVVQHLVKVCKNPTNAGVCGELCIIAGKAEFNGFNYDIRDD